MHATTAFSDESQPGNALRISFAIALLFAASCGPREAVGLDADDEFATACAVADDCVAVYFGDVCRPGCPNGAVHVDARADYDERVAREQAACTSIAPAVNDDCITDVACLTGLCLLRGG